MVGAIPARPEATPCLRLLEAMAPTLLTSLSPRQVAFTVIGLSRLDDAFRSEPLDQLLRVLALRLYDWYNGARTEEWRWFEDVLSYDNARLPQALIAAGFRLDEPDWRRAGIEALDWYALQCGIDTEQRPDGRQPVAAAAAAGAGDRRG